MEKKAPAGNCPFKVCGYFGHLTSACWSGSIILNELVALLKHPSAGNIPGTNL